MFGVLVVFVGMGQHFGVLRVVAVVTTETKGVDLLFVDVRAVTVDQRRDR